MFSLEGLVDLPLVWSGLIGTAVLLYVLLDGLDLGVGILFPFAPSDKSRDRMMNSIAPFWDGNETWLVLGGGGLFAAFPLAYAILMPALYLPVTLMLFGLIFRGVAFEFRFKAAGREYRPFFMSLGVFITGYIGIAVSIWPYAIPFEVTFREAAAAPESQSLLLVGTVILLPIVLGYTGYCYYLFRGKASDERAY